MTKSKYDHLDKKDLLKKIAQLEKKRYGLVWEDKPEEVAERCDRELPVLVHRPDKEIAKDPEGATNLLIEGDNYHALFALNFTHRRKIDVIYIDPPYNTGAKDWKYNNNYVDENDRFRHSKWLSMMNKRLRLAKNLLKTSGIIVVTIDDYEIATLRLLMNDIFGSDNHLGTVVIRNNPSGRSTVKGFSINHEYALFYSATALAALGRLPHNDEQKSRYGEKDKIGLFEWENFRKSGTDSDRNARPKQFYPIIINRNTLKLRVANVNWNSAQKNYELIESLTDEEEVLLPEKNKVEKVWKFGLERLSATLDEMLVKKTKDGYEIYRKKYLNRIGSLPRTWWDKPSYSARDSGTRNLTEVLGSNSNFNFPKAPEAVKDCLSVANLPKGGIVLDFFAGSGTTGQAVLELNKLDGGKRKFILCTNNESEICEKVTYRRIHTVIEGYSGNVGIPANLKYFTTDFVPNILTDNDKRVLVSRSTELLCIAEDTFTPVVKQKKDFEFAIFKNPSKQTAIIYDEDAIDACIEKLIELKSKGTTTIYVFSYDQEYNEEDFEKLTSIKFKFKVMPIPEAILNVYLRNAKLRHK